MPKRDRRTTARPPVLTSEIVVGQQLRVHRAPARSTTVCDKAGGGAIASAPFCSGRTSVRMLNPRISCTERHPAVTTRICHPKGRRNCGKSSRRGGYVTEQPVVKRVCVGVEIWRPPEPANADVHAEQIKLTVARVELGRAVKRRVKLR